MRAHDFSIPGLVWESLVKSCGLRRREWEQLRVGDIRQDAQERIWLHIPEREGVPARDVPVLGGFEWAICAVLARRFPSMPEEAISFGEAIVARSPDELLVPIVPARLNMERGRRSYARWLYMSMVSSLQWGEDPHMFTEVGEQVRQALGLSEIDVTIGMCICVCLCAHPVGRRSLVRSFLRRRENGQ